MNKKKNIIIGFLLIVAIAILGAMSLSQNDKEKVLEKPKAIEPIKIGVIFPLSGDGAMYGQPGQKGVELAIQKIKKDYNLELKPIYEDDRLDPKTGVNAMQKLVSLDNVKYVLGYTSAVSSAICPLAESNKTIFLTLGSSPNITDCGDYTFRDYTSDTYQGKELAKKVFEKGYKKVAIMYINNDYGKGLKTNFENNYNGEIVFSESHNIGEADFKTQLIKIKSANPDAVILVTYLAEGGEILKQRTELGLEQPVFGSEAIKDQTLIEKTKPEALKNVYLIFASQYEGKEFDEFAQAYRDKYKEEYGIFSDYIYDNVLVLGKAISACENPNDAECVKTNLYETNIIGATGAIKFDQNGDIIDKPYSLYKIENNQFVLAE